MLTFPEKRLWAAVRLLVSLKLLHLHGADLGGKAEQIDEALCVVMVVQIACGKRSDALIVERIGGSGSGLNDIALVKLEFHFACNAALGGFDKRLYCLAQG